MTTYTVHLISTVSTSIDVEADDPEAAIDAALESRDMPGSITYGAFGNGVSVDHSGDWNAVEVSEGDEVVWSEHPATLTEDQAREMRDDLAMLRARVAELEAQS